VQTTPDRPPVTVEGTLDRVVFSNAENGWSVLRVVVAGRRDPLTAVGNLPGVQPGETLRLTGRYVIDKKFGEQLAVESFVTVLPSTLGGIERYLGSGLVRGIGRSLAKRLVAHFGLATLEVIEHAAHRLTEVEGIGPVRRERIEQAWAAQREIKNVMLFLQTHGVSTAYATRIYRLYGAEAIRIVKENPYRLATDVWGIGFKSADKIADRLGIARDAPSRLAAGLLFALGEAADEGHLYLPESQLLRTAAELLAVEGSGLAAALATLAAAGQVVVETEYLPPAAAISLAAACAGTPGPPAPSAAGAPAGGGERAVYLAPLHTAERGLAERLRTLAAALAVPLAIDLDAALRGFEQREQIELAAEQQQAIRQAIRQKVLVVTGGPGTGKTTLIRGVVSVLARKGRRVLLAAPTGRAAKRLAEATGSDAQTIHRLLAFDPRVMAFTRNQESPLDADVLVVDEASMLDTVLAYHLAKAVPDAAQLVLVGDVDQLPSVGPGRVLADLIASRALPVVRLGQVFRQAATSRIVRNAHRINRGELPDLAPPEATAEKSDFFFIERESPAEILATLEELVVRRIPSRFGFDPIEDVQVLTPMRRGELGTGNLNQVLQQLLNPDGAPVGRHQLRLGDKVMQTRNNYELEVFNGDLGRIRASDPEEHLVEVEVDGRAVVYEEAVLDELALAYACSVHKAQGSEYPCVVIPLHTQHYLLLQRNLLYTAVTRGRRLVVLVGSRRALQIAVRNDRGLERFSRLAQRLRGAG
jgi:exodeoxyribonuclease V alpha subunit